jgi:hypothetical protein
LDALFTKGMAGRLGAADRGQRGAELAGNQFRLKDNDGESQQRSPDIRAETCLPPGVNRDDFALFPIRELLKKPHS